MSDTNQLVRRDDKPATPAEGGGAQRKLTLNPAVDVVENEHGVTLWADLPGVAREDLGIHVHDGNLRIEASARIPTRDGLRLQHAEVRVPDFARSFTLGPDFDTSKIEARLNDGVLTLLIPRREEARPRRVEIRVG